MQILSGLFGGSAAAAPAAAASAADPFTTGADSLLGSADPFSFSDPTGGLLSGGVGSAGDFFGSSFAPPGDISAQGTGLPAGLNPDPGNLGGQNDQTLNQGQGQGIGQSNVSNTSPDTTTAQMPPPPAKAFQDRAPSDSGGPAGLGGANAPAMPTAQPGMPLGSGYAPGETPPGSELFANPPAQNANAGSSLIGMGVQPGTTAAPAASSSSAPPPIAASTADAAAPASGPASSAPTFATSSGTGGAPYTSAASGQLAGKSAAELNRIYGFNPDQEQTAASAATRGGGGGSAAPGGGAAAGAGGGGGNQPIHQALAGMGFGNPMQRMLGDFFSMLSGHGNPMALMQDFMGLMQMIAGGGMAGMQGGQAGGQMQIGQVVNWRGRQLQYIGNGRFRDAQGNIIDGQTGQVIQQGGGTQHSPTQHSPTGSGGGGSSLIPSAPRDIYQSGQGA